MEPNIVVMIVTLIIWVGLFGYMMALDRKVKRLEEHNES